jgi:hypothetical protein
MAGIPGFFSFRNRITGRDEVARPVSVLGVSSDEGGSAVIAFAERRVSSSDKFSAIIDRIQAVSARDETPVVLSPKEKREDSFATPNGDMVDIQSYTGLFGAWMSFKNVPHAGAENPSLGLVSQHRGQNYIQYRDGITKRAPRFVLSVDGGGKATLQFVVDGPSQESTRVRFVDLDVAIRVLDGHSTKQPAAPLPPLYS